MKSDKIGEVVRKAALASTKTAQAKKDRVSNKMGLIEGVDSKHQWHKASSAYTAFEPLERIGARRKML